MDAWVGTSGWTYRDWRGRVYPHGLPQRDWLPWFSTRFATVEINASFYRLPERERFEAWADATPPGFVFAVKMSRYLTHLRKLRDPREPVDRFWTAVTGLGSKRGPVLFQTPPTLPADLGALEGLLAALPPQMEAAFEFRHPTWDTDAVRELLRAAGAAWVLADRPFARVQEYATAPWAYVRFHRGRRVSAGYASGKLHRWADRLAGMSVDRLFVYFNNDPGGAAPRDALRLTALLRERGVAVRQPDGQTSSP
jgi:uncharacterized protein YecE (DUF72 family)